MLKSDEFYIFLSGDFGKKCKHTELTLNFIHKQHFSQKKKHFPFIILKQQHREPAKIHPSIIKIKQKFNLSKKIFFHCVSEATVRKVLKKCPRINLQVYRFQ